MHRPSRYAIDMPDSELGKLEMDMLHDTSAAFQALLTKYPDAELARSHLGRLRLHLAQLDYLIRAVEDEIAIRDAWRINGVPEAQSDQQEPTEGNEDQSVDHREEGK